MHEFHIFSSHTEWNLLFRSPTGSTSFWLGSAIKLNTIYNNIILFCRRRTGSLPIRFVLFDKADDLD